MNNINILICGICGAMGKAVIEAADDFENITVTAGYDKCDADINCKIYHNLSDISNDKKIDVVIDFSHMSVTEAITEWCAQRKIPLVSAVTGLDEKTENLIRSASEHIAVFRSSNFSYGVSVLNKLVFEAVKLLHENFDIELVEAHHNRKTDAPSGTAKTLLETIDRAAEKIYDKNFTRYGSDAKRDKNEVGVHAIRGGTITGEHSVIFAGNDEVITISHSAASRKVFAYGALKAALFIADKPAGYYSMEDIVND